MQITSFIEQLKALTWSSHQALEKYLVQVIRSVDTIAEYKKLLIVFYGYYQPLEKLIYQTLNPESAVLKNSRKSDWLLTDIRQLDNGNSPFSVCTELPPVTNHVEALAALYVLEGSTLGGKYILQMIRKRIELEPGHADQFLRGHGLDTEANWMHFKSVLDQELSGDHQKLFTDTVNKTFDHFKKWVVVNYSYVEQEKL